MTRCFVALGGNLGDVESTFNRAIGRLGESDAVRVVGTSDVFRSAPVGAQAGGEFRNAAATLETTLHPLELLDLLQSVETEFGRTRELHWGPRTLDLDLILYGAEILDHPRLKVPHPACWYRRFVLDPLAQIAGDVVHPEKGITIGELRARLLVRPLPVVVCGGSPTVRLSTTAELERLFPEADVQNGSAATTGTYDEAALLFWLGPSESGGLHFDDLPQLPRIDASQAPDPLTFAGDALRAALGL